MKKIRRSPGLHFITAALLTMLCCIQNVPAAQAEAPMFDATVRIINGTTGQPGAVDMITLTNQNARYSELASLQYQVGEAAFHRLRILDGTPVLIHGVSEGVDFYAEVDGLGLKSGRATLYVFETTTDTDGVEVRGMNLVVRQHREELQIEYIWSITNRSQPQKCLLGDPNTLEVLVPDSAKNIRFHLQSAPRPDKLEHRRGGAGGYFGVSTVLRPGQTSIGLTFTMPYTGEAIIPVGATVNVRGWSILTSPSTLWVSGSELTSDSDESVSGFQRKIGPELTAGQRYEVRITGGTESRVVAAEQAHAVEHPTDQPAVEEDTDTFPWVVILPSFIAVIAVIASRRNQRRKQAQKD